MRRLYEKNVNFFFRPTFLKIGKSPFCVVDFVKNHKGRDNVIFIDALFYGQKLHFLITPDVTIHDVFVLLYIL